MEGRENTFLVVSGRVESGGLLSVGGGVFRVGKLVEVGWDFVGLEICRQWDGKSVGTILVPDKCLVGENTLRIFSRPFSRVLWTRAISYHLPCTFQLPSIRFIPYWAELAFPACDTMAVLSTIAQEQAALPIFDTRRAYLFGLFRQALNSVSHSSSPLFAPANDSIVSSDGESVSDLEELEKAEGLSCFED